MDTITRAESLIKSRMWSQIYCLAGICDLTVKNRPTSLVSIRNHNVTDLIESYLSSMSIARDRIASLTSTTPKPKCIFAPVTGIHLETYNKRPGHLDDRTNQKLLDETISVINPEVVRFNSAMEVATPWTSRIIHKRHRNQTTNRYDRLSPDGCHLSHEVRHHWADSLHEAVVKNTYTN